MRLLLLLLSLSLAICGARSAVRPHPRLILTPDRASVIAQLRNDTDDFARFFIQRCLAQADSQAAAAADAASVGDPSGRPFIQALYSLLLGAVVAPAPAVAAGYRAAAAQTLLKVAAASEFDPNGTVALNTGEVLHGLGIGLDWLYGDLSAAQRAAVVAAIAGTGLSRVRAALSPAPPPWAKSFVGTNSNWNTVILGGSVIAALAIQGEPGAPAWLDALLADCLADLTAWSASAWAPDGAWPEGLNYGGYTQRYLVPTIASLLTATGGDAGLRALPGVLAGPRFLAAGLAPTRPFPTLFDYFDARTVPETTASWLATAAWAGDAPAAAGVKAALRALAPAIPANDTETTAMNAPLALLYYTPLGAPGDDAALPLVQRFGGVQVVVSRSSRDDPNATFIAFKGLNTTGNWAHTHLDQGSFVFATQGQFFVQDLGSDSYAAPGYFDGDRFRLLRTNISGHNTISLSGRNPRCIVEDTYKSDCPAALITVYNETPPALPERGQPLAVDLFAVVNLTQGMLQADARLRRLERGFIVGGGRTQLVTVDEAAFNVSAGEPPPPPLWWSAFTVANVSLSSDLQSATLTTFNTSSVVTVAFLAGASQCPGAAFSVSDVDLAPPLLEAPGVRVLRLAAPALTCARLVVAVGEQPPGVGPAGVRPLADWAAHGPLA